MNIRLLRESDLPDLMALKTAANWNQTEDDWLAALRYEPEGCFGVEVDGRVVASAAAACYDRLSWIGMVLTLPEFRGRGFARLLTQAAVVYSGNRAVRLDASDLGRPLYESMGFVAECATERWFRAPAPASCEAEPVGELRWDRAYDTAVFGADRTRLLEIFARDEGASVPGGYAFGRPGSNARYFGPCVAESVEAARRLMAWFVGRHPGEPLFTDLFPHHLEAVKVATEFGFVPARRLTRMVLKPVPVSLPDRRVFATGSFSWG